MESYHALRLADMPISVISVLQVFSTVDSFILGFSLESRWRLILVEFQVNLSTVPEPQNHHLNKDGSSASCDNQYQILNIKRLRNLYLAVLLLDQVNWWRIELIHFQAKDVLVVHIVLLNASIENCVLHALVRSVCVWWLPSSGNRKHNCTIKFVTRNTIVH
jgi:hypothetical protein